MSRLASDLYSAASHSSGDLFSGVKTADHSDSGFSLETGGLVPTEFELDSASGVASQYKWGLLGTIIPSVAHREGAGVNGLSDTTEPYITVTPEDGSILLETLDVLYPKEEGGDRQKEWEAVLGANTDNFTDTAIFQSDSNVGFTWNRRSSGLLRPEIDLSGVPDQRFIFQFAYDEPFNDGVPDAPYLPHFKSVDIVVDAFDVHISSISSPDSHMSVDYYVENVNSTPYHVRIDREIEDLPPVAKDVLTNTPQDTPVDITVRSNNYSWDPNGSYLYLDSVGNANSPNNGSVFKTTTDKIRYTPDPGFTGTDSFSYKVGSSGGSDTATAHVTVGTSDQQSPHAVGYSYDGGRVGYVSASGGTISVLAYCSDDFGIDGSTLQVTSEPDFGSANPFENFAGQWKIDYTPDSGFTGYDAFSYRFADNAGNWSNIATVEVIVGSDFDPNFSSYETLENSLTKSNTDPTPYEDDDKQLLDGKRYQYEVIAGTESDYDGNTYVVNRHDNAFETRQIDAPSITGSSFTKTADQEADYSVSWSGGQGNYYFEIIKNPTTSNEDVFYSETGLSGTSASGSITDSYISNLDGSSEVGFILYNCGRRKRDTASVPVSVSSSSIEYDFESGNPWTTNVNWVGRSSRVGYSNSTYSLGGENQNKPDAGVLAEVSPSDLSGGKQITSLTHYYYEYEGSYGGGIRIVDSSGNYVVAVGTDNPQWKVLDYSSGSPSESEVYSGDDYQQWHKVSLSLDWGTNSVYITWENMDTGTQKTDSAAIPSGSDAETIELVNYGSTVSGQYIGGSTDFYHFIDDVSIEV